MPNQVKMPMNPLSAVRHGKFGMRGHPLAQLSMGGLIDLAGSARHSLYKPLQHMPGSVSPLMNAVAAHNLHHRAHQSGHRVSPHLARIQMNQSSQNLSPAMGLGGSGMHWPDRSNRVRGRGGAVEFHAGPDSSSISGTASEYTRSGRQYGTDTSMVARKSYGVPSGSKTFHGPIPVFRQAGVGVPVKVDYRTPDERRQGLKM